MIFALIHTPIYFFIFFFFILVRYIFIIVCIRCEFMDNNYVLMFCSFTDNNYLYVCLMTYSRRKEIKIYILLYDYFITLTNISSAIDLRIEVYFPFCNIYSRQVPTVKRSLSSSFICLIKIHYALVGMGIM